MKEDFYKHIMNRGFIVFESDSKFILSKFPTPADSRLSITDDIVHNSSSIEFQTWDEAIAKVKRLCNWKNPEQLNVVWEMQMMYQHYGLGAQMIDLGQISSVPFSVAMKEAKQKAVCVVEKDFKKGEIEKWEVRVRPCKKFKNDTNSI